MDLGPYFVINGSCAELLERYDAVFLPIQLSSSKHADEAGSCLEQDDVAGDQNADYAKCQPKEQVDPFAGVKRD